MFIEKLKAELNILAPDWEWSCVTDNSKSPDLISPKLLSVSARNRLTGHKTSSIQVSNTPDADAHQAAQFICDVLMIHPPAATVPTSALFQR